MTMKFLIVMDSGKEYKIEADSIEELRERLTNGIGKGVLSSDFGLDFTDARVLKNHMTPLDEDGKILINPSHISSIEVMELEDNIS